ncbi:MAG TPA: YgaP-like transmembrane domain [Pseudomonas sp.]|nr:YgaP-like transmembrane domain [Pseudomonas sp.]
MHDYDTHSAHHPQNVHGWERTLSIAGGFFLLACGLRRGGLTGLAELGLGAMALTRGMTGQCAAKRALCKACSSGDYCSIDEHEQQRRNADAATSTSSVTGNDSLDNPLVGRP